MSKILRNFKISHYIDWTGENEIKQIREDLDTLEKLGATHIEIKHGVAYDCSYVEFDTYVERLETDEEYADRINEEKQREDNIMRRELEQLEKLKLKYNQ